MNLSNYIANPQSRLNPINIYNRTKRQALNLAKTDMTEKQLDELSNQLNSFFYPNNSIDQEANKEAFEYIKEAYQERLQNSSNKVLKEFLNKKLTDIIENNEIDYNFFKKRRYEERDIEKYNSANGRYTNITAEKLKAINSSINGLKQDLIDFIKPVVSKKEFNTINKAIKGIESRTASLVAEMQAQGKTGRQKIKSKKKDLQYLEKYINTILDTIGTNINESGAIMEAMTEYFYTKIIKDTAEDLTSQAKKNVYKAINRKGTGNLYTGKNGVKVEILSEKEEELQEKFKEKTIFVRDKGGEVIELELKAQYDVDKNRQIKADIIGKIPQSKTQQRISVKNWTSTLEDVHNFGNTTLLNALVRTLGDPLIRGGYIYGMQNPTSKISTSLKAYDEIEISTWHNVAKLCMFLDIVMGYSQGGASVNYLLINDQRERKIKFISLSQLLEKIDNSIKSFESYDENNIYRNAISIREHTKRLTTPFFQSSMYSFLQQIKVTIKYSELVH